MEVVVKKYQELTLDELYQILKVRNEVFVVEQNCPYQDIDDKDQFSIHVMAKESNQVVGYVRVFASKDKKGYGQIGRVLTTKRKSGIGALVFEKGIQVSKKQLELENIYIEAQEYAIPFYQRFGFEVVSHVFLEDDIPHVKMEYVNKINKTR